MITLTGCGGGETPASSAPISSAPVESRESAETEGDPVFAEPTVIKWAGPFEKNNLDRMEVVLQKINAKLLADGLNLKIELDCHSYQSYSQYLQMFLQGKDYGSDIVYLPFDYANIKEKIISGDLLADISGYDETVTLMLAFPKTSGKTGEALQFLTWLYSKPENYRMLAYGIEGEDYNLREGDSREMQDIYSLQPYVLGAGKYFLCPQGVPQEYWDYITGNTGGEVFISKSVLRAFDPTPVQESYDKVMALLTKPTGIKMILWGLADESLLPNALQELEDAGINDLVREYQRQLDDFNY